MEYLVLRTSAHAATHSLSCIRPHPLRAQVVPAAAASGTRSAGRASGLNLELKLRAEVACLRHMLQREQALRGEEEAARREMERRALQAEKLTAELRTLVARVESHSEVTAREKATAEAAVKEATAALMTAARLRAQQDAELQGVRDELTRAAAEAADEVASLRHELVVKHQSLERVAAAAAAATEAEVAARREAGAEAAAAREAEARAAAAKKARDEAQQQATAEGRAASKARQELVWAQGKQCEAVEAAQADATAAHERAKRAEAEVSSLRCELGVAEQAAEAAVPFAVEREAAAAATPAKRAGLRPELAASACAPANDNRLVKHSVEPIAVSAEPAGGLAAAPAMEVQTVMRPPFADVSNRQCLPVESQSPPLPSPPQLPCVKEEFGRDHCYCNECYVPLGNSTHSKEYYRNISLAAT